MRTVGSRYPFAGLGLGLDQPPLPIAATFVVATALWTCTFDKPLQPGPLDAGNWTLRENSNARSASTASAAGNVVSGLAGLPVADPGADVINFAPPPADVLNLTSQPAVAFTDFPLVVT